MYQFSWANAGLDDFPNGTIWELAWNAKTGEFFLCVFCIADLGLCAGHQQMLQVFELELRHTEDLFKTIVEHDEIPHVIFMLVHNHNIYLAQVCTLS